MPDADGPVPFYSSDVVDPAADERVALVLAATTDETPLLSGVVLTFGLPEIKGAGPLPDYRIAVETTNDPEAAYSSDRATRHGEPPRLGGWSGPR